MNSKTTKRALLTSILALITCIVMLLGTTFAWFTDSVTSGKNIIKSGNLDIQLYWADGKAAVNEKTVWTDASNSAIFNYDKWEPGYTEVRHVMIKNAGTLALKYSVSIIANGAVSDLADVIDVYYLDPAKAVTARTDLTDTMKIGTLSDVLDNLSVTGAGALDAGKSDTVTIALKMQESAGNDYMNLSIGSDFSVQVNATQNTVETDSFDKNYDKDAVWDGTATYDWYTEGYEAKTYKLSTASDLAGLANLVNGTADLSAASGVSILADEVTYTQDDFKGATVTLESDVSLAGTDWTPIGNSKNSFKGNFDGKNHTISDLKITGYNSNAGLFGFTTDGSVKNVTVENATVSGRLNVGVIAGTPYTSTYDNITVKGDVKVNGMSYVGGVFGKNVYANVSNITVDANEGSYVNANSVENGVAYRTYVGGVIGFIGEGSHIISNVKSNIDVIGSTCDIGGITGIAHYNNTFKNITCTGNVTGLDAGENEIGGIAGVWHNANGTKVTFENCTYTGTVTLGGEVIASSVVGPAYTATGTGKLYINGNVVTNNVTDISSTLENGGSVVLGDDITTKENIVMNGGALDGNGNTLDAYNTSSGSDCAVTTTGGTVSNVTIVGDIYDTRAIGAGSSGTYSLTEDLYIKNVTIDKVQYAINGSGVDTASVIVTDSTVYGWLSFSGIKEFSFDNCTIGKGNSYDGYMVVYGDTTFTDCTFETFDMCADSEAKANSVITFTNCTNDGVKVTVDNFKELFKYPGDDVDFGKLKNHTIIIDGKTLVW